MGDVPAPISARYEARIRELERESRAAGTPQSAAAILIGAAVLLCLVFTVSAVRHRVPVWWPALPLPFAAAAIPRFRRLSRKRSRAWRLKRYYEESLRRLQGKPNQDSAGESFQDSHHPYSRDLNLFGPDSLFARLCSARTSIGRSGLAAMLLEPASAESARERQDAVRDLAGRLDIREAAAVLGDYEAADSRAQTFTEWLDQPSVPFHRAIQRIAAVTSTLVILLLALGLAGLIPWLLIGAALLPLILFHAIAGLVYQGRVRRMIRLLSPASVETALLREGLALLETSAFQSAPLLRLSGQARGASRAMRRLERLLRLLQERNKEWFYPLSLLTMGATQICMAIEDWRTLHDASLRTWIAAWSEFEALNSIGTYAGENPAHTFPEFTGGPRFDAESMGNPLLPDETSVRNDVRLDGDPRSYMVSGSNMSGKSTLLRAIGLNAVLAMAGDPVPARSLRLSPFLVYASIGMTDSLAEGKSRFLAEMDRVRLTLQAAAGSRPVLFLFDEILAGTNSRDRRAAAEAVVRTLVDRQAVGAISTHDIALTEIAGVPELHGLNVHLGARDESDPMSFDYKLKPGITTETNALAIARMAGVPL